MQTGVQTIMSCCENGYVCTVIESIFMMVYLRVGTHPWKFLKHLQFCVWSALKLLKNGSGLLELHCLHPGLLCCNWTAWKCVWNWQTVIESLQAEKSVNFCFPCENPKTRLKDYLNCKWYFLYIEHLNIFNWVECNILYEGTVWLVFSVLCWKCCKIQIIQLILNDRQPC